jgi:hypothetical protein
MRTADGSTLGPGWSWARLRRTIALSTGRQHQAADARRSRIDLLLPVLTMSTLVEQAASAGSYFQPSPLRPKSPAHI